MWKKLIEYTAKLNPERLMNAAFGVLALAACGGADPVPIQMAVALLYGVMVVRA